MVDDPLYRTGPGGVPAQVRVTGHGESDPAASGCYLGLPSAVYIDAGSGIQING